MSHAQRMFPAPVVNDRRSVNARVEVTPMHPHTAQPTSVNKDGRPSYDDDIYHKVLQALLTNTIGNTFYSEEKDVLSQCKSLFTKMAKRDPVFFRKALQFARNDGNFKLYPIVGLEVLSTVNTEEFKRAFPKVILTPADLKDFMSILEHNKRGQGGRAIRKVAGDLLRNISEYHVIKYGGEGRGYSLKDLMRTVHPKPLSADQAMLFRYICHGNSNKNNPVSLIKFPQLNAYEKFKRAKTDEEKIRYILEGKLPFEVATSKGVSSKIWNAIFKQMPLQTLIKNINTLDKFGLLVGANYDYLKTRLLDPVAIYKAGLLPRQWITAYNNISNTSVRTLLEAAVDYSFKCLPQIDGDTAVFLDVSGSMSGNNVETGAILGLSMHKNKTSGNSLFWMFNTQCLIPTDLTPDIPALKLINSVARHVGGGTNTGACVEELTRRKIRVNNIVLFTDEQQNSGRSFYKTLQEYKQKVNRNVRTFIVDVSPDSMGNGRWGQIGKSSKMAPVNEPNLWYIFGWTDQVLNFISLISRTGDSMVDKIKALP